MQWRVTKTSSGYYAEKGVENHNHFIMTDFIVYESLRFDTEAQARKFITKQVER